MLKETDQDTIAAIATAAGEGGVGIVRVSGKDAISVADKIFKSKNNVSVQSQKSFTVQHGFIMSGKGSECAEVIDEVLLLVMRAPKSYTREDVIEISAHGGPAVLNAILRLVIQAGARLAARGEFTKRAFLNGRLDLLQAEAVLDLVKARTELGRHWAAAQLEGLLSRKIKNFKNDLLDILSHLEASIDFPDDFPDTQSCGKLAERLGGLSKSLEALLSSSTLGFIVKQGVRLAILGRPNVGKSSLMNQLAKSNRVIVTPYPGTTRDVVEEEIQIKGLPVRLLDTAGIHDASHPIEKEGIERSKRAAAESDLILYTLDGSQVLSPDDEKLIADLEDRPRIVVVNKSDLPQRLDRVKLLVLAGSFPTVDCSCVTEEGIFKLEEEIYRLSIGDTNAMAQETVVSTVRQKDLIEKSLKSIKDARSGSLSGISQELVAVDVRLALDNLGMVAGEVVTDDLLEVLFNQFCIGK